jgi:histidyl-tRNA synthetase
MGGPPTPGIGFGIGLDRTLLACNEEGILTIEELAPRIDVFVVDFAGGDGARDITAALRRVGVRTDRAFGGRSPKSQLKSADRSGARLALIIGPDEAASGRVAIKDLRSGPGTPQELVDREALVNEIRRRLSSDAPTVGAASILES